MRARIVSLIAASALFGAGYLYAQPGATPAPGTGSGSGSASGSAPAPEQPKRDIADVTVEGETKAQMSPREMDANAEVLIKEMEGYHRGVLSDQAQAKTAKDVIKLNCVNENLLAVKQLLNLADTAENELDEAIAGGNRDEQIHQYGKITIAHDKASTARTESQNCIGEELHFVGKNDVTVDGPVIKNDPTDDGDVGQTSGDDPYSDDVNLEDPAFVTPFSPE